jgi:ABC-type dipeptide/oligopeptide/nickel transport system permease subunit
VASTESQVPVEELWTPPDEGRLRWARFILRHNRAALFGGILTTLFILTGIAGLVMIAIPALHPLYLDQNLANALQPPPAAGGFGTDPLGRSLLARVVAGTGVSLGIATVVTIISLVVGGIVGILAGYHGGKTDLFLSGIVDIAWGFPIVLIIVILAGVMSPGLLTVVVGIALINWAGFARIIRGEVLKLRERDFVRAAHAVGVPTWKIMTRHIAPNVIGPTLVLGSYYVAITIIAEAGTAFIGVGAQPPTPSLGQIIAEGQNYWAQNVWVVAIPGAILALIVLGLNTLGDGLRDLVDPRLRTRG